MNDLAPIGIALAINLILFGIFVAIGIGIVFRLRLGFPPRVRYLMAVITFCLTAFYPVWVT